MKVAVVAWKLRRVRRDSEFFSHYYDFVEQAHAREAEWIIFPELPVLELLHLVPDLREQDVPKYLAQYAEGIEEWLLRISANSGLTIVSGSHFRETDEGIVNACGIASPDGRLIFSYKNNLTTYEREVWTLRRGEGLSRLQDHRVGVTICYDSEFPESGRALAEEGVLLQAVPAFTETRHGHQRVRFCCQARATENQVFVAHAALIGDLGREPVPTTYGSSAILTPSISPFPYSAVLDETPLNQEGIAFADLDFDALLAARDAGDVRNWNDRRQSGWPLTRFS
jgi:predicted amidohydrolase